MTAPLVSRVRRARRPGTCPLCKGPIQIRESIAKAGFWCHTACLVDLQASQVATPERGRVATPATGRRPA
jgi:hypothetical protein